MVSVLVLAINLVARHSWSTQGGLKKSDAHCRVSAAARLSTGAWETVIQLTEIKKYDQGGSMQ